MNRFPYRMCDPTGNITALIRVPLDPVLRPEAAAMLMRLETKCEQVGFAFTPGVAGADISLQMAGGEFCGNATMSAAALYAEGARLAPGETESYFVSVSGARRPVPVRVTAQGDFSYAAAVQIPGPERIEQLRLSAGGDSIPVYAAHMAGITHLMITQRLPRETAERAVKKWCAELGVPALGLMLLDEQRGELSPLVYVPVADTLFWESSCASGTAAVGACLALRDGRDRSVRLRQPGGALDIEAEYKPRGGGRLLLSGGVKLAPTWKSLDFPAI